MFANHDDNGHFMFKPFHPKTPVVAGHTITGTVTIEPQLVDKGRMLKAGDQILIYYDHDMEFDGLPGHQFLPRTDQQNGDDELERVRREEDGVVGKKAEWNAGISETEIVDDVRADSDFEVDGCAAEESHFEELPKKKSKSKKRQMVSKRKGVARRCRSAV
ncbi:hypothetical protein QFC22_006748 [Naganishia vaughanmartiniae]|nr:hypothetical protein QFC22_006748 [Naganishia vaughanmartiniae]